MGYAPKACPMCNNSSTWIKVDKSKKGFSTGKAVAGGLLLGPIGLLSGTLGKSTVTYCCGKCGFTHDYSG